MMTANSDALVASNAWRCWAVKLTCWRSTAPVKPIARAPANAGSLILVSAFGGRLRVRGKN
jgi:hypothetical protein